MAVTATLLPDGSVAITDGTATFPPLSPDAVQAVAAQANASAQAYKTQALTETLTTLAGLITAAGPVAGAAAYAQVTVTPGAATAVLDKTSFALVKENLSGVANGSGNWVVGQLTVSEKPAPTPTPTPTPPPAAGTV